MGNTIIQISCGSLSIRKIRNFIDVYDNYIVDSSGNFISDWTMGGLSFSVNESIHLTPANVAFSGQNFHYIEGVFIGHTSMHTETFETTLNETLEFVHSVNLFTGQEFDLWVGGYPKLTDNVTPYVNLYTQEYWNSPKLLQFGRNLINIVDDGTAILQQMATGEVFDLNQAFGSTLDMLGQLVGVSRTVPYYLGQIQGSLKSTGWTPLKVPLTSTLNDDDYRILLKAQIGANNWDGKIDSLAALWSNLFPTGQIRIQDNQDMTINVYLTGHLSATIVDLIINGYVVPRPEGVLINYYITAFPLFGFDGCNSYIQSFDTGHWV